METTDRERETEREEKRKYWLIFCTGIVLSCRQENFHAQIFIVPTIVILLTNRGDGSESWKMIITDEPWLRFSKTRHENK